MSLAFLLTRDRASAQCQTSGVICGDEDSTGSAFRLGLPISYACSTGELVVMADSGATIQVGLPTGCPLPASNCIPPVTGRYCISPCNPVVIPICAGGMVVEDQVIENGKKITVMELTGAVPELAVVMRYFEPSGPHMNTAALLGLPSASLGSDYLALGHKGHAILGCSPGGYDEGFRWLAIAHTQELELHYKDCDGIDRTTLTCIQPGRTFQLECPDGTTDITGNYVSATECGPSLAPRPFTLIGGTEHTSINGGFGTTDSAPLWTSQLPITWGGTRTMIAPLQHGLFGNKKEIVRVVAVSGSTTTVDVFGSGTLTNIDCPGSFPSPPSFQLPLPGGRTYCDFETDAATSVCTDEIVQVVQYHKSYSADLMGNPSMFTVVPQEKWKCHHRFYTFATEFPDSHVTILAPESALANTELNGVAFGTTGWTAFPDSCGAAETLYWRDVSGLAVLAGENTVDGIGPTGNPIPVGVVVHGYRFIPPFFPVPADSAGMYVYPGGLKF